MPRGVDRVVTDFPPLVLAAETAPVLSFILGMIPDLGVVSLESIPVFGMDEREEFCQRDTIVGMVD